MNLFKISNKKKKGKGSAVRHGVMKANGDLVMFTDADLAYDGYVMEI